MSAPLHRTVRVGRESYQPIQQILQLASTNQQHRLMALDMHMTMLPQISILLSSRDSTAFTNIILRELLLKMEYIPDMLCYILNPYLTNFFIYENN